MYEHSWLEFNILNYICLSRTECTLHLLSLKLYSVSIITNSYIFKKLWKPRNVKKIIRWCHYVVASCISTVVQRALCNEELQPTRDHPRIQTEIAGFKPIEKPVEKPAAHDGPATSGKKRSSSKKRQTGSGSGNPLSSDEYYWRLPE